MNTWELKLDLYNWHKTQGYVGTLRCGQAFIWNKNRGLEGYLQTNVMSYGVEEES